MNALQGLALGHGVRRGAALWSGAGQATIASLALPPHAGQRRSVLQAMYGHLNTQIGELDQRVTDQAGQRPQARRLMTHPGVGPVTALATEVFLGDPARSAPARRWPATWGKSACPARSCDGRRLRCRRDGMRLRVRPATPTCAR